MQTNAVPQTPVKTGRALPCQPERVPGGSGCLLQPGKTQRRKVICGKVAFDLIQRVIEIAEIADVTRPLDGACAFGLFLRIARKPAGKLGHRLFKPCAVDLFLPAGEEADHRLNAAHRIGIEIAIPHDMTAHALQPPGIQAPFAHEGLPIVQAPGQELGPAFGAVLVAPVMDPEFEIGLHAFQRVPVLDQVLRLWRHRAIGCAVPQAKIMILDIIGIPDGAILDHVHGFELHVPAEIGLANAAQEPVPRARETGVHCVKKSGHGILRAGRVQAPYMSPLGKGQQSAGVKPV